MHHSLQAEAHTRSHVGPDAKAQRASQVVPLGPEMRRTANRVKAPTNAAVSNARSQGSTAGSQARAREQAIAANGHEDIASQMAASHAERARYAKAPPPALLHQTGPAAMHGAVASADAAIAGVAHTVKSQPAHLHPFVLERAAHASQLHSKLPPFDHVKFTAIDLHHPLPAVNTAPIDAAQKHSDQRYERTNQRIDQMGNIPAPVVRMPSGQTSGKTKDGRPTREAAIANIEHDVIHKANAEAPAKMKQAAAGAQHEVSASVGRTRGTAQQTVATQLTGHKSHAQEIHGGKPLTTGAQAAAHAYPQVQAHQAAATQASERMRGEITTAKITATTNVQVARGHRDQQVATAHQNYNTAVHGQLMPGYQQAQQQAHADFNTADVTAQHRMRGDQEQAHAAAETQRTAAKAKADADTHAHEAQLHSQQAAAHASHDHQVAAANIAHEAKMTHAQQQADQHVQQDQSRMEDKVTQTQTKGQADADAKLRDGETGYNDEISRGQGEADAVKAKAERDAAAKKAQAEASKNKGGGGGLFGKSSTPSPARSPASSTLRRRSSTQRSTWSSPSWRRLVPLRWRSSRKRARPRSQSWMRSSRRSRASSPRPPRRSVR